MRLSRLLAWEVVLVHALTGVLFATALAVLALQIDTGHWWLAAALSPIVALSWLGWLYEAWIIWQGTAALRQGHDGEEG